MPKIHYRVRGRIVSLMSICLLTVACSSNGDATDPDAPIRLGLVAQLTGPLAGPASLGAAGVRAAVDVANAEGEQQYELVIEDAPDPTSAQQAAQRLIDDGVDILLGAYSSGPAETGSAVAERNQKIWWETAATSPALVERGFKYFFKTDMNGEQIAEGALDFIEQEASDALGPFSDLRVMVVGTNDAFGVGNVDATLALLEGRGVAEAKAIQYAPDARDLSAVVQRIDDFAPDALIQFDAGADTPVLFTRSMNQLRALPKLWITLTGAWSTPQYREAVGAQADGIFIINHSSLSDPSAGGNETLQAGAEAYAKYSDGEPFTTIPQLTFAGAYALLMHVIPEAGSTDPNAVREAALSMDLPAGSLPNGDGLKFAGPEEPNSGQNLLARPLVAQWQPGESALVNVWPEDLAQGEIVLLPLPGSAG